MTIRQDFVQPGVTRPTPGVVSRKTFCEDGGSDSWAAGGGRSLVRGSGGGVSWCCNGRCQCRRAGATAMTDCPRRRGGRAVGCAACRKLRLKMWPATLDLSTALARPGSTAKAQCAGAGGRGAHGGMRRRRWWESGGRRRRRG